VPRLRKSRAPVVVVCLCSVHRAKFAVALRYVCVFHMTGTTNRLNLCLVFVLETLSAACNTETQTLNYGGKNHLSEGFSREYKVCVVYVLSDCRLFCLVRAELAKTDNRDFPSAIRSQKLETYPTN
jgi:hypothetical protein